MIKGKRLSISEKRLFQWASKYANHYDGKKAEETAAILLDFLEYVRMKRMPDDLDYLESKGEL